MSLQEFTTWRRSHGPQYSTSARSSPKYSSEAVPVTLLDLECFLAARPDKAKAADLYNKFCEPTKAPTSSVDREEGNSVVLSSWDGLEDYPDPHIVGIGDGKPAEFKSVTTYSIEDASFSESYKQFLLYQLSKGEHLPSASIIVSRIYLNEVLERQ